MRLQQTQGRWGGVGWAGLLVALCACRVEAPSEGARDPVQTPSETPTPDVDGIPEFTVPTEPQLAEAGTGAPDPSYVQVDLPEGFEAPEDEIRGESPEILPPSALAEVIRGVQMSAPPGFFGTTVESGVAFTNDDTLFTIENDADVVLADAVDGQGLSFRLASVNGKVVGEATPILRRNRVTLSHGEGVEQWFVHGPLGLEQGFHIEARDDAASQLRVELSLNAPDFTVTVEDDQVLIADASGRTATAESLYAFDTKGQALASTFETTEGGLAIVVDTENATWPIDIDPVWRYSSFIYAPGGADDFGFAVDTDGTQVIVGAPASYGNANGSRGRAYVFSRGADGRLSLTGTIQPGPGESYFGRSVGIDGDRLAVGGSSSLRIFDRSGSNWSEVHNVDTGAARMGAVVDVDVWSGVVAFRAVYFVGLLSDAGAGWSYRFGYDGRPRYTDFGNKPIGNPSPSVNHVFQYQYGHALELTNGKFSFNLTSYYQANYVNPNGPRESYRDYYYYVVSYDVDEDGGVSNYAFDGLGRYGVALQSSSSIPGYPVGRPDWLYGLGMSDNFLAVSRYASGVNTYQRSGGSWVPGPGITAGSPWYNRSVEASDTQVMVYNYAHRRLYTFTWNDGAWASDFGLYNWYAWNSSIYDGFAVVGEDLYMGSPYWGHGAVYHYTARPYDSDRDGVPDDRDACPYEAFVPGYDKNGDGCTDDTDGDGYTDDVDVCPAEDSRTGVDTNPANGCLDVCAPGDRNYCFSTGSCNAQGTGCDCEDVGHRSPEDRCQTWYQFVGDICQVGDRTFCGGHGACTDSGNGDVDEDGVDDDGLGDSCVCDDPVHYRPDENCAVFHQEIIADGNLCAPGSPPPEPHSLIGCHGNGTCDPTGSHCNCYSEWWNGLDCSIQSPQCPGYGRQADGSWSQRPCSGHGACFAADDGDGTQCDCDIGYVANPSTGSCVAAGG